MSDVSEFRAAFDAGRLSALEAGTAKEAHEEGVPYLVVPDGHTIQPLNGDLLEAPLRRIKASPVFSRAESFNSYVMSFDQGNLKVFADPKKHRVAAILDYHEADGTPKHCDHAPALQLALSANWQRWSAIDRKPQSQVPFAEFLEDALGDIASPDGAEIMQAVTTLESHREVCFKSAINLSDGMRQFQYVEENGAKGSVIIPQRFELALPVFEGGERILLTARLRYKIAEDKIWFTVVLDNPAAAVTDAFGSVADAVGEALKTAMLIGTP